MIVLTLALGFILLQQLCFLNFIFRVRCLIMDSSWKDFPEIERDMLIAISSGNEEKLHDIIDSFKPEYLIPWEESKQLITKAIACRRLEMAKILLKKGCVIGDTIKLYPLFLLCGDFELVKLLLDKDPQSINKTLKGETPLYMAVREEIESIVKLLIDHGANVNLADSHGLFPLNYAARVGNVVILKMLLDSGANVDNILLQEKESSLMSAIKYSVSKIKDKEKYTAVVKELLNAGANVNFSDSFGRTPLHFACSFNYKDAILLLLDAGANVNANDIDGNVPFNRYKTVKLWCCKRDFQVVPQYLIEHLILIQEAGLYLHTGNKSIIDVIMGSYCHNIEEHRTMISSKLLFTGKCRKEIDMMKNGETVNGSVLYDILKKLDNFSLYSATEMEIQLLNTVISQNKFPLYTVILKTHLKYAKLRRSLLAQAQCCLASLTDLNESKLPFLPEEIRIHIVSYLETSELDLFIKRLQSVRGNMR